MGIERLVRPTCLIPLLAGSLFLSTADATDQPGLRAVGENGMELCLDRSTVDSYGIGRNVPYAMPGTEENPTFAIEFKLNDLATHAWTRLTTANVGAKLQYWFDGHLLGEPTVSAPIRGGGVLIVVDSEAEARAVAAEAEAYRCSRSDSA